MAVGVLVNPRFEDPDRGHVPSLTQTQDGYEGTRYAMVRADDLGEAIATPGLPKIGEPWSDTVRGAIVTRIGNPMCYEGRTDNGLRYYVVQIDYESPRFGGVTRAIYRKAGDAVTEFSNGIEQQTVYYPVDQFGTFQREAVNADGTPLVGITPDYTPIANGDGVSIEVGAVGATVSVWYEVNQAPNYARLARLARPSKLNITPVSLPPLDRSTQRINFEHRQVRYRNWTADVELSGEPGPDGLPTPLLKVTHSLALAEHHDTIWQAQDAKGEPNGRFWRDRVYADADYTGLWP